MNFFRFLLIVCPLLLPVCSVSTAITTGLPTLEPTVVDTGSPTTRTAVPTIDCIQGGKKCKSNNGPSCCQYSGSEKPYLCLASVCITCLKTRKRCKSTEDCCKGLCVKNCQQCVTRCKVCTPGESKCSKSSECCGRNKCRKGKCLRRKHERQGKMMKTGGKGPGSGPKRIFRE
jgi:hypothetical protein